MADNTFNNWQNLLPMGIGGPGAVPQGGGGGYGQGLENNSYGPQVFFRDSMDARRSMWGQTPEATYPSGYLGTINSRRDDRLLDSLKNRQAQKAYQRGVHKGERIDPADYFWPKAFTAQMGIERQMKADGPVEPRFSPILNAVPVYSPNQWSIANTTPGIGSRSQALRALAPEWR
jgi:hypothetical protein